MNRFALEELKDIKYNIYKLLKFTKSCKKFFKRPISKKFYEYLIENFDYNGLFKCGESFLEDFEISRERDIKVQKLINASNESRMNLNK